MYLWEPPDTDYMAGEPVYPTYVPGTLLVTAFFALFGLVTLFVIAFYLAPDATRAFLE